MKIREAVLDWPPQQWGSYFSGADALQPRSEIRVQSARVWNGDIILSVVAADREFTSTLELVDASLASLVAEALNSVAQSPLDVAGNVEVGK